MTSYINRRVEWGGHDQPTRSFWRLRANHTDRGPPQSQTFRAELAAATSATNSMAQTTATHRLTFPEAKHSKASCSRASGPLTPGGGDFCLLSSASGVSPKTLGTLGLWAKPFHQASQSRGFSSCYCLCLIM